MAQGLAAITTAGETTANQCPAMMTAVAPMAITLAVVDSIDRLFADPAEALTDHP